MVNKPPQDNQVITTADTSAERSLFVKVLRLLLLLGVLFGAALSIGGFFAKSHWGLELLTHLRLNLVWGFLALCPVTFGFRFRGLFVASVVGVICNALFVVPVWLPPFGPTPTPKAQKTVCFANVLTQNTQYESLISLVKTHDPDLLLLAEIGEGWRQGLTPLYKTYPHHVLQVSDDNFGLAVLSKFPLTNQKKLGLGSYRKPAIRATVAWPQSSHLTFYVTHPTPPVAASAAEARNTYLDELTVDIVKQSNAVLVAGDLNLTPWSPYFDTFLTDARLKDTRKGVGLQATWPTMLPGFARIPIDHILTSYGVDVFKRWVAEPIGSDHLPVCAQVHVSAPRIP